jgi:putative FmdB family regulatory protein
MPFYEYECSSCKYAAEVLQRISDAPMRKCPSCGKGTFKRLISAPVFRLKGSGWYETDFKSDKENKRNLAGAEREEAKSETKAEAKPAEPAKAAATPATKPAAAPRAAKKRAAPRRAPPRARARRRGA